MMFVVVLFVAVCAIVFVKTYQGNINLGGITISNPASENCVKKGGTLEMKKNGKGDEYGVCIFEDNRQCEEWALFRNECPETGLKITGYITEAAIYCVISGGEYKVSNSNNESETENGTCTFFNGQTCNASDFYNGTCQKGTTDSIVYDNSEFNFSLKLPISWKDNYEVKESTSKVSVLSFLKSGEEIFRIDIVPESFWNDSKSGYSKLNYIGRYENTFMVLSFINENSKDEVERIKKTFKITKPYIFSEDAKESGKNYSIDIKYPYLGAVSNGQVNIDLNNFINNIVTGFKNRVSAEDAWTGENTFKLYYEPYEVNDKYVSLRIDTLEYNGGAHGFMATNVFNYDLQNNKIISLDDVFDSSKDYLNKISNKSIEYLLKINEKDNFSEKEWIEEGAKADKNIYSIFIFNNYAITFYFDQYQVAPYAAGRQQVILPFSAIKDILKNEFVTSFEIN